MSTFLLSYFPTFSRHVEAWPADAGIVGRRGQIAARRETLNGRLWYGEGGGGGGVFLGFEKKIPKYPVEMCKGIKDLFLVIYRNHLHHLHPLWVISVSSLPCLLSRNCTRVRVHHLAQCLRCRACAPLAGTLFLRGFVRFRNGKRTKKKNKRKRQREYGSLPNKGQCQKLYAKNAKNIVEIFSSETFFFCLILFNRGLTRFDKIICTFAHRKTYKS